jgi:hypothetical protein
VVSSKKTKQIFSELQLRFNWSEVFEINYLLVYIIYVIKKILGFGIVDR